MAKQTRPAYFGIAPYSESTMALTKSPPKEPFNLGPIYQEDRGIPWWGWAAIIGFALGIGGFMWTKVLPDEVAYAEEKRVFMGQCVVVKGETEKRCAELWRWRVDR
jgi:hypothetical protein